MEVPRKEKTLDGDGSRVGLISLVIVPFLKEITIYLSMSSTSLFTPASHPELIFSSAFADPSRQSLSRRKSKISRYRALKPTHPFPPLSVQLESIQCPLLSLSLHRTLSLLGLHAWIFLAAFPTVRSVTSLHNSARKASSRSAEALARIASWIDPIAIAAGSEQVSPEFTLCFQFRCAFLDLVPRNFDEIVGFTGSDSKPRG